MFRTQRRLVALNPALIAIRASIAEPTWWDQKTVQEDLTEYVSLFRFINATPVLRVCEGALVAITGLPFVRAAQQAEPPLEEIICALEATDEVFRDLHPREVAPREMLQKYPEQAVYRKPEILSFTRSLTFEERQSVEHAIESFFRKMVDNPQYGGKYRALGDLNWRRDHSRLMWTWERCDAGGEHRSRFFATLKRLQEVAAPIQSLNGIRYDFKEYPDVT